MYALKGARPEDGSTKAVFSGHAERALQRVKSESWQGFAARWSMSSDRCAYEHPSAVGLDWTVHTVAAQPSHHMLQLSRIMHTVRWRLVHSTLSVLLLCSLYTHVSLEKS